MIVLGVDPGVRVTGYGVVARELQPRPRLLECGVIRTAPDRPLAERLLQIYEGVSGVIERLRPDAVCVEGVFYGRNVRTTVVLGHARAAVLLAAAAHRVPVAEYPPAEVKNAVVGSGSASKEQVGFMVKQHLALDKPPAPPDAADGVAVALCHLFQASVEGRRVAGGSEGRRHLDQRHTGPVGR